MNLILGAFIKGYRALADGSMSVTFETQELSPEQHAGLGKCLKKSGVLVFKPDTDKLTAKELKVIDTIDIRIADDTGKSPSQKLRGVFYKLFEKDHEGYDNFDAYYMSKMNKLVIHYKQLLDNK